MNSSTPRLPVSVCMMCRNEEFNLQRGLDQVAEFAEWIVADTGSTDRTAEIARERGAIVRDIPWQGFSETRRQHFAMASQPWILWIDADEVVTPELVAELRELFAKGEPGMQGYRLDRVMNFNGVSIRHGDWHPDRVLRLFRADSWSMGSRVIHESVEIKGRIGSLKSTLPHYSYRDWDDRAKRVQAYSKLWAEQEYRRGRRSNSISSVVRAGWRFIRGYILMGGILDGALGLRVSLSCAREVWLKYSLLSKIDPTSRDSRPVVIHTEASHGWGGQEIRTLTECEWFAAQGFRCVLLTAGNYPVAVRFRERGFEVIDISFKKFGQLGDFMRCFRIFRHLKPEFVGTHSNIDSRVALAAAAAAGVPRRIRYRHVSIQVRVSLWNRLIYRHFATGVITTANSITRAIGQDFKLPADSIMTIPTGVRDTSLDDRDEARKQVFGILGLGDSADRVKLITQVSVLRSWKGHKYLIDAFDRLAPGDPDLHLMLVGGGNNRVNLEAQAAKSPARERIHFVGHQTDVYPFFKAADVVALASTDGEGVPQTTLQCFACRRPFVGTRIGGIPDVVTDGESGLLVPAEDSEAMAAAISRVLTDPALAERLADGARRTYDERGSIPHMGRQVREFAKI